MPKQSNRKLGIKTRWITHSLGIVVLVLIFVIAVFSVAISNYYYTNMLTSLEQRTNSTVRFFNNYLNLSYSDYYTNANRYAEYYEDKKVLELQFLNINGKIEVSSSGLVPGTSPDTPDIAGALVGAKVTSWIGIDPGTGERVMAISGPLLFANNQVIGAVRFVSSLTLIDRQVFELILIAFLIGLLIIGFVVFSNLFFIRSIVEPVRKINEFAKRIAEGRFGAQIDQAFDDEIGELSETINNLSTEIKNAEKMKNDFISSVSHELRTPLTAINGWGETVLYMDDVEEMKKGVSVMMKETKRLSKLVEELLEYTMMDSGRMKMQMERIDLAAEFEEVIFLYVDKLRREGVVISYRAEEDIPPMTGDRERLKQVFFNILDNAAKHGGSGEKIDCSLEFDKKYAIIKVRDYGPGVPKEDLAYIKKRYYKGISSTRGSGIGLAIANEIILLHDGTLTIENAEGGGAVVTIRIPTSPYLEEQ